jgi:phage gp36-like protein
VKKITMLFLLTAFIAVAGFTASGRAARFPGTEDLVPHTITKAGDMAYCTIKDLQEAYGPLRIAAWSRQDGDTADRAISNASAEIDGYLLSGGYTVPLPGTPENLKKYCIDIAVANLIVSIGAFTQESADKEILEQAKQARRYLEKVAEGKFRIPGYSAAEGEVSKPPPGGVRVSARKKLDLSGF